MKNVQGFNFECSNVYLNNTKDTGGRKKVGRDEGGQMMECHVDGEAQTMAGRGSRTM